MYVRVCDGINGVSARGSVYVWFVSACVCVKCVWKVCTKPFLCNVQHSAKPPQPEIAEDALMPDKSIRHIFFMSLRTRRHLVSYRDPDFRISVGASPSTKYTHLQSTAARRVLAHRTRDRRHHSVPVEWANLPTTQLGRFATDVQLGPHTDRADHTFDRMWYTSVLKGEGNRNFSFVFNNQKLLMRKGIVRLIESK